MKLGDLGERRILSEILPNFVQGIGDDCAVVGDLRGTVVVTTDPVPAPAARVIGGDPDPYWIGWLLVTINASDLAAAGARPHSFVAALDLPSDMEVDSFERLLAGIGASCKVNGLRYIGGNLREAGTISGVGTAIGECMAAPLTRRGAMAGDKLVVFGEAGRFWADAERIRGGIAVDKRTSPIFAPVSQASFFWRVAEQGLVRCAMDTSDGLAPSLTELSKVNDLHVVVDLPSIRAAKSFSGVVERPERLWMGWGDWTLLAAVDPKNCPALLEMARQSATSATIVGEFASGSAHVELKDDGGSIAMDRLESERFAKDSWFSAGIDEYIRRLKEFALP